MSNTAAESHQHIFSLGTNPFPSGALSPLWWNQDNKWGRKVPGWHLSWHEQTHTDISNMGKGRLPRWSSEPTSAPTWWVELLKAHKCRHRNLDPEKSQSKFQQKNSVSWRADSRSDQQPASSRWTQLILKLNQRNKNCPFIVTFKRQAGRGHRPVEVGPPICSDQVYRWATGDVEGATANRVVTLGDTHLSL